MTEDTDALKIVILPQLLLKFIRIKLVLKTLYSNALLTRLLNIIHIKLI
jgi:hypothetical protein